MERAEKYNISHLDGAGQFKPDMKQIKNMNCLFGLSSTLICIAGFDGYFKKLSPAWENLLGYSVHELLSKPYHMIVHSVDIDATNTESLRLKVEGFVNRYRCKGGRQVVLIFRKK